MSVRAIRILVCSLLVSAALHAAPLSGAAFGSSGQEVVVDLSCTPTEVEIGQPVTWTLIVEHPLEGSVRVSRDELESPFAALEDGRQLWVELADRRRTIGPIGEARRRTTFEWTVCALDSGEQSLEGLRVDVDLPERLVSRAVEGAMLLVRSELGDGEDTPRPMAGFRPPPPGVDARTRRWLLPALVLFAVGVLAIVVRRRRKAPVVLPERDGPLDELDALAESLTDEPGAAAELGYDLSHLLRRTADETLGERQSPLTDLEWAARIEDDERLPATLRGPLARLLRDLEPLKYAGSNPTRFALKDLVERARGPLEEFGELTVGETAERADVEPRRGAA